MSNIAKLKKKAAEYEARKNFEKALDMYEQVLTAKHPSDEERDVALYNRVGDLHYRLGNNEQALSYYEQAADFYAEGGFFNNAIALCNKILRYSPGRTIIYYKLGIISAKKGFNSDAKQNFLEYADRMQRLGKMDEAFRALKEFADLCPGQDDVRLMLAEQLTRASRKTEALEQLEILYEEFQAGGRSSEAGATLERMNTLDPAFKPRRSVTPRARQKEGLVFLDLDFDDAVPTERGGVPDDNDPAAESPAPKGFVEVPRITPAEGLEPTQIGSEGETDAGYSEPDFAASDFAEPDSATPVAAEAVDAIASEGSIAADLEPASNDDSDPGPVSANELKFITPIDVNDDFGAPMPEIEQVEDFSFVELPPSNGNASDGNASDGNASNGAHAADALSHIEPVIPPDEDFIDLGEWLERNRTPVSTRMVTHDEEPENNEQKDFGEMLDKFKEGISRNVDDEDFESHYDLGIAFREMGLLDEAIGSFQKASRGAEQRVRASEAIGQCFMDKGEAGVTVKVLERLLKEPGMSDAQMVGVLYLLGRAAESLNNPSDAAGYFERVLAVQIGFRDTATRLSSLAG